jgi:hypothetical protein
MISNDPATCTASFPRPIARDKDTLKRAVDGLTLEASAIRCGD